MFHHSKLDHIRELYSDILSTTIPHDNARFRHIYSEDFVLKTNDIVRHLYDERETSLRLNTLILKNMFLCECMYMFMHDWT